MISPLEIMYNPEGNPEMGIGHSLQNQLNGNKEKKTVSAWT